MTIHDQLLRSDAPTNPATRLIAQVMSIGRRIVAWVDTCRDHYAAAAMYEQLSALSDAELARRGLSRATLARDVCAACDRASSPAAAGKARAHP
jgi:hypothetical protein